MLSIIDIIEWLRRDNDDLQYSQQVITWEISSLMHTAGIGY